MKNRSISRLILTVILVAGILVPSSAIAAPAPVTVPTADYGRGLIVNHVTVDGIDLFGLTERSARAILARDLKVPAVSPVTAVADGRFYTFSPATALTPNLDAIMDAAYETTTAPSVTLDVPWMVRPTIISGWVSTIAKATDRAPVNARWVVKGRRLALVKNVSGRSTQRTGATTVLRGAVTSSVANVGSTLSTFTVPVTATAAKITTANIGKAIIVSQGEFKVFLYNGARVEKTYGCAVGMPSYPTPVGTFKVIAKAANPSWHNPGSDWGANMPSVIPPGPTNPLGTRALYLNSPGIRIHGTSKYSSIGHRASHGCIRLRNPDVENLYPRVPVGTPVFIVR